MMLDMDAGNTRLKWALHNGDIYTEPHCGQIPREQIQAVLASFDAVQIERVRLSSVAGDSTEAICAWGVRRGIMVEVAKVVDRTAGLVCGYRQPERLGIDRWLALLAARRLCSGAYAVADAGTALTLDLVDETNTHLGGFIAPGLQMMRDSLGANTWGITLDESAGSTLAPGKSTAEAVANGCCAAALGMIENALAQGRYGTLLLTGGDAERLALHLSEPEMTNPFRVVVSPHLVLAGLSVALP